MGLELIDGRFRAGSDDRRAAAGVGLTSGLTSGPAQAPGQDRRHPVSAAEGTR
ncbi:hypothetical protein GCM10009639_21870 [Kitasatospora putterlickiae]|uniref:Uncharacterized protein n=1 Tax=Kitasatospora putterlickiae TaxID=221725 RepID=A0ABP4IMW0_9ACTN